jgi:hypothetical protein
MAMLWLILGLLLGVVGYWLVTWTRARGIRVTWYEYLIEIAALILALVAIQNFVASLAELEPQAAWILLALFGVPALILACVGGFMIWRRQKSANLIAKV